MFRHGVRSSVRSRSCRQITTVTSRTTGDKHPRILEHRAVIFQLPQQRSPGWQGFRDAQAEQSQVGFAQNEYRDGQPELGRQHGAQIGKQMPPDQPGGRRAGGASLKQEIRFARLRVPARRMRAGARPSQASEQQERDGHRRYRRGVQRKQGSNRQQQKQPRQRQKQIDGGGDDAFPASSQVTGRASDQACQQCRKQSGGRRQQHRDTGSIQQAGQPVPAQIVGPQPESARKEER